MAAPLRRRRVSRVSDHWLEQFAADGNQALRPEVSSMARELLQARRKLALPCNHCATALEACLSRRAELEVCCVRCNHSIPPDGETIPAARDTKPTSDETNAADRETFYDFEILDPEEGA